MILRTFVLELLELFRAVRSVLLPPSCRFTPTCSEYASVALNRYHLLPALLIIFKRLSRCHPFHPGGYDPIR